MPWAVYRQDFHGNKFTIGVDGVYTTIKGDDVKVEGLESEAAALEAARQIDASHFHPHKAYYLPVHYEAGKANETFRRERIQII